MGSALFDDIHNPLMSDLVGSAPDAIAVRAEGRHVERFMASEPLVDPRFIEDSDEVYTARLRGRSAAWHTRWMQS